MKIRDLEGMSISVVIPIFNEQGNIRPLCDEVSSTLEEGGVDFEIIFVNDGSSDGSLQELMALTNVRIIDFSRNFGQTAAMAAGINHAKKDLVTFLDGDGQNNPKDILKLLEIYRQGDVDLVCGWRRHRADPFLKKFISKGARRLRKLFFNDKIHDSGCTLKLLSTEHAAQLALFGELHRFIPALGKQLGWRISEVEVNHRPRNFGHTKYNWRRVFKAYLDMVGLTFWARYATRPLHIFGALSLIFGATGSFCFGAWIYLYATGSTFLKYALPSVVLLLWLSSIQIILIGLLADRLVKSSLKVEKFPGYLVRSVENL